MQILRNHRCRAHVRSPHSEQRESHKREIIGGKWCTCRIDRRTFLIPRGVRNARRHEKSLRSADNIPVFHTGLLARLCARISQLLLESHPVEISRTVCYLFRPLLSRRIGTAKKRASCRLAGVWQRRRRQENDNYRRKYGNTVIVTNRDVNSLKARRAQRLLQG